MQNDVVVIGAGVVGSSVARELSRYNLNVVVLEAGSDVAEGASKANSAIVHAGFDAKPGTNKAKFNVLGNRIFEDVCRELRVPFRRNGSLVLAFGAEEEKSLEELKEKAAKNGVPVEIIGRDELRRREPNVSPDATAALWAPTGGICCPYELTFRMAENAAANGVTFVFDKKVVSLSRSGQETASPLWKIASEDGSEFEARAVVNCAGIHSDELNNLVSKTKYAIEARRGEYLMLDKDEDGTFSATMFQVPSKMGKGILVSPTVDGTVIVGPTAEDIPDKEDKATTYAGLEKVKEGARRTYPDLPLNKVITEFSGLRAHETTVGDFILGEAPDAPGFFNAVGVESPGLTSAPAIGVWMAEAVAAKLGVSKKNPALISKDVSWWPKTREMAPEALAELVERDPSFGRVICRCEGVTEGEIRAAIRARVGARTLDGVKRRTRSGMGRCQGGFCTPRLIEILGAELGLPPEAFLKSRKTAPKALGGAIIDRALPDGVLDVLVVGAGPAGLAAACAAKDEGAENVLVLERDDAPGGILQQCIHNGFGLHRFSEELTGPEYAQRYVDLANERNIPIVCGTMVLDVKSCASLASGQETASPIEVTAMSPRGGLKVYKTKAVVLAMGCRERPRGALMTPGTRPAGVYTAGTVQRLVNMDGIMPGKRVVILGSGDIGLIMARRLTFSGAKVLACIEIMKKSSGLMRNVVQCLNDYDIPLLLSHTVTDVEGREHVTGVKVSKVDDSLKPIPGTEMHFDCDTLVLSCGLIPENELTKKAGIEMDPKTRGPKVDPKTMATSVPGVFAGGNVVRVYDLVDWVSRDSALAGKSAAAYARKCLVPSA